MRFFRRPAAQLLLTFVIAISLLGTGLHLLPGCNHFHEHRLASNDHSFRSIGPAHSDADDCDDDCPICHFLAIPWALTVPPAIIDCGQHFEPVQLTIEPSSATPYAQPYSARGPPPSLIFA